MAWNTIDNYNPNGKPLYMVVSRGKAMAYTDQTKYLPSLPFKLPRPGEIEYAGSPTWIKVKNGYLVGYDHGEWGGSLHWFSFDGKAHYKISGSQVQTFVKRKQQIYALTDGSHQGIPMGRIGRLDLKNGTWTIEPYLRTNTISHSITASGKELYIIAHQGIFRINDKNILDTILTKPMWERTYIYNTSLIKKGNQLYMGMWEGVYRYNLKTGKQDWFSIK